MDKVNEFERMKTAFQQKVDEAFALYDFDLVVYDEIEYFRDYKNPLFNYPYQKRKNKVQSFSFSADPDRIADDGAYDYNQLQLKFQTSQVCLQPHYME